MSPITRTIMRLALLTLAVGAATAHAETINCIPITTIPSVITVQGVHCFMHDLTTNMTSGFAIEIQTNNVTVDLNGFKLGGLAAGTGTNAVGIVALDRQNITIKNGTIRGFAEGIFLFGNNPSGPSRGHIVEDIRADQNTIVGLEVHGAGSIVRNNQVVATGGATASGDNVNAIGIFVGSPGVRVLNNDVINTVPRGTGSGRAVVVSGASGALVEGNRLSNEALPNCCGSSEGVRVSSSSADVLVVNNRISKMLYGISYVESSTGKYRDNLTSGINVPFTGGTDAGNNN